MAVVVDSVSMRFVHGEGSLECSFFPCHVSSSRLIALSSFYFVSFCFMPVQVRNAAVTRLYLCGWPLYFH